MSINPIQAFVDEAMSHYGEDGTFAYSLSGLSAPYAFCAAFIVSCAKAVEQKIRLPIIGNIIYFSWGAYNITAYSSGINGVAVSNPGTWINGPMLGNSAVPMPGDIILYKYPSNFHVGIVRGTKDGVVYTMEGNVTFVNTNTAHMCDTRERSVTDPTIYAYCRPNWAVVGGSYNDLHTISTNSKDTSNVAYSTQVPPTTVPVALQSAPTIISPLQKIAEEKQEVVVVKEEAITLPIEPAELVSRSLYTTESTAEDAIVREVGYVDYKGNRTADKGGIRLSVINYTPGLSALVRARYSSEYYFNEKYIDTDLLDNTRAKVVCRYLLDKGFNATQMLGIFALIWKISDFQPDFVDTDQKRYGIMGWDKDEMIKVIKSCGRNWANNMTAQLDYIWVDMCLNRKEFIEAMENTVVKNEKSYIKDSVELALKEYWYGYSDSILNSCTTYAYGIWEKILVEDSK